MGLWCVWHAICKKVGKESAHRIEENIRIRLKLPDREKKMKTQMTAIKTRNAVKTDGKVDEQILKVGFGAIGVASCALGVWALASLIGGMVASGGPLALVANWFRAVTG